MTAAAPSNTNSDNGRGARDRCQATTNAMAASAIHGRPPAPERTQMNQDAWKMTKLVTFVASDGSVMGSDIVVGLTGHFPSRMAARRRAGECAQALGR